MNPETPLTTPTPPTADPASVSPSLPTKADPTLPGARPPASPSPTGNGETPLASPSRHPGSSRLPRARGWSSQGKILLGGGLGLAALALVLLIVLSRKGLLFGAEPFNGPTFTVKREKLRIAIVERGSLESAKNADVICTVRARSQGSTIATSIKWLVDPGEEVKGPELKKEDVPAFGAASAGLSADPLTAAALAVAGDLKSKGQKLMELDSSGLQEQLKTQIITVEQAKANWIQATEDYRIVELDNETEIEKAQNARDLAKIDLQKYTEGEYVQAIKDVEGRIETARSDLETWKDRAAWSNRMLKKGLVSKVQAEADDSKVDAAKYALQKVEEEKRVLTHDLYGMKKRTIQDLKAKLSEATRNVEKAKSQARSKMAQAEAKRQSTLAVYEQEMAKKRDLEAEIAKCTILAPQDGLVVYYVPEQVRGGGGSQQSIVAQGEPVREGQKMLQIPDLSTMLVNVRVHEALVSHLHNEESASDPSTWQRAQIRVEAFPSRILRGHVKRVDTMASQQDWFSSDVKVYKTLVTIDETMEGLRPGMSAEVTIYADETPEPVLVVPVQSVVGTIRDGAERKVFVIDPDGQPVLRSVVVGTSNERLVEVKSGLKEGERVVLNPAPLLGENSELKAGKTRTRNGGDDEKGGGEGGKKGKKKGGGKGFNGGKGPNGFGGPGGPGGPGVPGGPGAQPAGGKGFAGGKGPAGGGQFSQEQMDAFVTRMRGMTPAERRSFLNNLPEERRAGARAFLRTKGVEVPD